MRMPLGAEPTIDRPPGYTPPGAGTVRRVALTGEVVEGPPPAPIMPPAPGLTHQGGYIPPAAYSAQAVQATVSVPQTSLGERWEKFLAIGLTLLALSMLLVHLVPNSVIWVAYADVFFLMLAMGTTGAVPSYDDAITDCSVMLIVSLFFGPLPALVIYLIVAAIKQECNGAIVGLLIVNILVPRLLFVALRSSANTIQPFAMWGVFSFISFLAVFVSFGGWLLSSFFRPMEDL